ncbi:hypothetical protein [uncultured Dysgonomonas sp.]|uniref:hypothetical protein n=1 Tax=uncultured Dysgonomonas sp. TaxID=206096 RepID=UPI002803A0E1|nr:hypothetical protein [uncultured Dysgonomonas sp.]
MAKIFIDKYPVLTLEYDGFIDKHWNNGLSSYLMEKYGSGKCTIQKDVEEIFLSGFEYLVDKFRALILQQKSELFFHYAFLLHETSVDLYKKQLEGYVLPEVINNDFPRYRRILKLILEQGCDIDITAKLKIAEPAILSILQELYYLAHWMYEFADNIALLKMIPDSFFIEFEDGIFTYGWKRNYGELHDLLIREFAVDYKTYFDEKVLEELKDTLEKNFSIDYAKALGIILVIKKQFSSNPDQTIEPYVLPINLAYECKTSEDNTRAFYNGLTLNRANKLSIEEAILKPHSIKRYMYRPILVYKIDGVDRALIGENKISESMMVLASNAIHWNTMQEEWIANKGIEKFMNQKGHEHDRLLEDEIEKIIRQNNYPFCRNIKSFKQIKKSNVKIDIKGIGEIDYIVVNKEKEKVFIADTKYNKARYEAVGYRMDHTNFQKYELQLERKYNWLKENLLILEEHLIEMFGIDYSIQNFEVIPIFFINTPTFYMFNGKYKAITLIRIKEYIGCDWDYPPIVLRNQERELQYTYNHPYFSNPPKISYESPKALLSHFLLWWKNLWNSILISG